MTGITLGYLFRNIAWLQKTEKSISLTIILLLFLLGTSVGSNQLIVNNLATFGGPRHTGSFGYMRQHPGFLDGTEILFQERR